MKLARFKDAHGVRIGQVVDQHIVSVANESDMSAVIAKWDRYRAQGVLDIQPPEPGIPLNDVLLLPPVMPNRNVFCVGWNYLKHFNESIGKREGQEVELPDRPTFFTKLPTTLAGPYDTLPLHEAYTSKLDWEVELAVIIGRGGRDIAEAEALDHVFAYTIANDISARDLQRAHGGQWFKGKSLDASCPLGPWLVTADEVADPQNLAISCHLNGQAMQSDHTSRQIFSVRRVIAELSAGLTLMPGDVILTGTPDGIGNARTPPVFIQDGDVIECRVDGIGSLSNTFQAGALHASTR
jgi:2-keto-4-pentenoate hydratase/2-oxohepta-3-ene-1,7-dioic acid hydratase in catechol pathway